MSPPQNPPPPSSSVPLYLQETGLPQETQDIISNLPKEKTFISDYVYQYQGFRYTPRQLHGVLATQKNFLAQETDIIFATPPKSGTTWLKAILFSLVKRVQHNPNNQDHPLLKNDPHSLVPSLELDLYFKYQRTPVILDDATSPPPRVFSTHIPFNSLPASVKQSSCKIVFLWRDPKDIIVSLWNFANKLRAETKGSVTLEEVFESFCSGEYAFGPFWEHVSDYWKGSLENPEKVFFLTYEEMKDQPGVHLRKLAEFLGCPFSEEEEKEGVAEEIVRLCAFENLSNLEVNKNGKQSSGVPTSALFRKGEVGGWKSCFSDEMVKKLDSITEEKMKATNFKF